MSLEKLLKQAKTELAELESATATARKRKEIATIEAGNLENRNRLAIEAIDQEAATRRQALLKPLDKEITELNSQIPKLKAVKTSLHGDIETLNGEIQNSKQVLDKLEDEKLLSESNLRELESRFKEIEASITDSLKELSGFKSKREALLGELSELESTRRHVNEDIDLLQTEAENLEHQIIDQDAVFKDRKDTLNRELQSMDSRLQTAINKVLETEKKDKDIRSSWAEGQLSLEKREKVVRKREVLLADSDTRLREADDFMRI